MSGYCFDTFYAFPIEPTPEELSFIKEKIVEELCNEIRRLAKERTEEFFIARDTSDFPIDNSIKTIGAKLIAPTISN